MRWCCKNQCLGADLLQLTIWHSGTRPAQQSLALPTALWEFNTHCFCETATSLPSQGLHALIRHITMTFIFNWKSMDHQTCWCAYIYIYIHTPTTQRFGEEGLPGLHVKSSPELENEFRASLCNLVRSCLKMKNKINHSI